MSNHLGDTNKMVETPRTDAALLYSICLDLQDENNALKARIKRLEEMYEGEIGEQPELLGSNVMGLLKRELNTAQKRIKQLEDRINRASIAFFEDGSDARVARWMMDILEEERRKP